MRRSAPRNGFTLIELMVTVAIVGITLAVVVPSISRMMKNSESDSLALELESDLVYARDLARTHAIQVTLEPVVGGNWSTGWFIQDANAQTFRTKGSLANPKSASGTITSTEFSSLNPFTIDARGRVTTTGSFSVEVSGCKGAHAHTISINFVGQITKSAAAC